MNVRELIENAYRCGQNDGYDFRDGEINKLRGLLRYWITSWEKGLAPSPDVEKRTREALEQGTT